MTIRAKMEVTSITDHGPHRAKAVHFDTRYDATISEDQRFMAATPYGSISMNVTNPVALDQFQIGTSFYVDFTPIPKPVTAVGNMTLDAAEKTQNIPSQPTAQGT